MLVILFHFLKLKFEFYFLLTLEINKAIFKMYKKNDIIRLKFISFLVSISIKFLFFNFL